jgi:hypothetical protein
MATCNTTGTGQPTPDMSRPQTNGTALNFIGDLMARSQERTFQRRISEKLAAGDCQAAANLAFAHERFDLSDQIRRSCAASPVSAPADLTDGQRSTAAFDLLCEGTETRISKAGVQEVAFSRSFRLNLASGRYCDGDCTSTRAIFRVEDTKITFYDTYRDTYPSYGGEQSVNRENGELFEGHIGVDGTTMANGRCERRPFSGFPQRQF